MTRAARAGKTPPADNGVRARRAAGAQMAQNRARTGPSVVLGPKMPQYTAPVDSGASTGRSQTLVLDAFPTPGQVRLLGPNTGTPNRYALSTLRSFVKSRVAVEAKAQGIRPVPPPVRVTLRYVFADARHRDVDNFAMVGKPVVDGLVKAKILAGDNAARLSERVEFVKERGARRLEVVIEALEPAGATPAPTTDDGEG